MIKKSKIDIKYINIEIIIAKINNFLYLVLAICKLFKLEFQFNNTPLFSLVGGIIFAYTLIIEIVVRDSNWLKFHISCNLVIAFEKKRSNMY